MAVSQDEMNDAPAMAFETFLLLLFSVILGALAAIFVLPTWLPGLSSSLVGSEPKAYWYLSRASAMVSYVLIWLAMALGVMISNKMSRVWPGALTTFDLHQYASLLGLAFALFHALILLGDRYIGYTLATVLLPFASQSYKPLWVGLGQLSFYLLAIVALSFYVRKQIGQKVWRLIHFLSFLLFLFALAHGIMAGTDSGEPWALGLYWGTGGSLLFLIVYRILVSLPKKRDAPPARRAPAARASGAGAPGSE